MTKNKQRALLIRGKLESEMSLINIYFHPKLHCEFYLNWGWQAFYVKDETVGILGLLDHPLAITITQLFSAAGREPEMAH